MIESLHAPSVWLSTANPSVELPRLQRDLYTDVAIVGGGYTGLVTAHHLSRAGVGCAVLEANDAGWGASGRNGGMAVLRYKTPWAVLAKRYGHERTRYLHFLLVEALDLLEETTYEYRISCDFARCGHITAAHGERALKMLKADVQWLESEARDKVPRIINEESTAELTGTTCYAGGYVDARAAGIHPLNYARGLAEGLSRKGVSVYIGAEVQWLREQEAGVILETTGGIVRAKQVLVATNAYTDAVRFGTDLGSRVVPVWTSVVTTEPLPDELLRRILPQQHVVSDTRHLLNYFRLAPENRLLYGGRGSLTGDDTPEVYEGLRQKLVETFPALAEAAIDHQWSGKVAVTRDDFPHVGRVSPRIAFAMGYGGRGVVLTNLLGKMLAELAMGKPIDAGPMSSAPFGRIPFRGLRTPVMKAMAGYYGWLDRMKR